MIMTLFTRQPGGRLEPTKYSASVQPVFRDGALHMSAEFTHEPGTWDFVAVVSGEHGAYWRYDFGPRTLTEGDTFRVDAKLELAFY